MRGGLPPCDGRGLGRARRIDEQGAESRGDRGDVLVRDEEPRPFAEQLHGVREPCRDDGFARGDRLDQDARDDLLAREVRQQHDVGVADLLQDRAEIAVAAVERHEVADAERGRLRHQRLPVLLTALLQDPRMGLPRDHVARGWLQIAEERDRLNSELEPLARADQPPGEDDRRPQRIAGRLLGDEVRRSAVRDHGHLQRVDDVQLEQPRPGGSALRDGVRGQLDEPLDDGTLPWRRAPRQGVEDHDRGNVQALDQVDDLVAVRAAEDAELVLHDDDVEAVERCCGGLARGRRPADQLRHDAGRKRRRARAFDAGHHADATAAARRGHGLRQRGRERRDPALRRRVRADEADGNTLDSRSLHGALQTVGRTLRWAAPRTADGSLCLRMLARIASADPARNVG